MWKAVDLVRNGLKLSVDRTLALPCIMANFSPYTYGPKGKLTGIPASPYLNDSYMLTWLFLDAVGRLYSVFSLLISSLLLCNTQRMQCDLD